MLHKDTLYIGDEARQKLISGIRKCAEAVGSTMGTAGSNSIIESIANPGYAVTNDGATILESIRLSDPIEELGRRILLEAVSRANKNSGDGSSTTCVLTASILVEGIKRLSDASPMEIKRSLEACIPLIEKSINEQKREIDISEVGSVASISAEDEEIGARIQEIYEQIGKEGLIYWDVSKTTEDTYTIGKGLTIEGASIASPYMCDRDKNTGNLFNIARLEKPLIIITKEKLTTAGVFEYLFMSLNAQGKKEVVIFCEDFDVQVIAQFVATHQVQGFRTVVVKMPILWRDMWYEDLAHASGATVLDPVAGIPLKDIKEEHLGTFEHITIDKESTYIDGIKDISEHTKSLEEEGSDESKLRLSRLNVKTARYFVGGHSESAISHRRYKVEDAIAASFHALNGGVVAGGGVALLNASHTLKNDVGGTILRQALKAPIKQIMSNTGQSTKEGLFSNSPIKLCGEEYGYDTQSGLIVNMFDAHITDPAVIVLNACKNAISVSANVLTANTLVLLPREEQMHGNPAMIV